MSLEKKGDKKAKSFVGRKAKLGPVGGKPAETLIAEAAQSATS